MANPAGSLRPSSSKLQAGNVFAVQNGDDGPQDNGKLYQLTNDGPQGTPGGANVPATSGDADYEPPTSLNGYTFAGTKGMPLRGGSGADPDEAPSVPVTQSGGSKTKR